MKLFGGKKPEFIKEITAISRGLTKKVKRYFRKMPMKTRVIIAICLVLAAAVITTVAWFINGVESPAESTGSMLSTLEEETVDGDKIEIDDKRRKEDFFTILIVGTDKEGWNTDTIMLAAFDIANGKLNILSIPRDTLINTTRSNKKINAAFAISGKGNIEGLAREVKSVTGIVPDKYALVDLDAFIEIIDAIGGVTVDVPVNMFYSDPAQDLTINIPKGLQTLDGYDAMGFMRFRKTYAEGDIGRIKVQQKFIKALVDKMITPATLTKIPKLAKIVSENLKTDLTLGNMVWLAKEAIGMSPEEDIKTFMLPGEGGYYKKLSYYFLYEDQVLEMINEHFNPYVSPIKNVDIIDPRGEEDKAVSNIEESMTDEELVIIEDTEQETVEQEENSQGEQETVEEELPDQEEIQDTPLPDEEAPPKQDSLPEQDPDPEEETPLEPDTEYGENQDEYIGKEFYIEE